MNKYFLTIVYCFACFEVIVSQQITFISDTSYQDLDTITITEDAFQSGDLTMTKNQYKIMPASFQDPSRILIKYPGFSTPNDGANGIVFRGFSPETNRWQLFGADIVNPNHLSNAGTSNDLSTNNAGGVNALSGSVLGYYHFEANPADVSYADVLSGVSDMKLAPQIKSYVDLNLIGVEAGINWANPLQNAKTLKNFYSAYRYSFVGLLSKLGVNFGNEKIGYQDFTFHSDIFRSNHINLKVFTSLGSSANEFQAVALGDSITRFKDIQNIIFKSKLGIGGVQFTYEKGANLLNSTLIFSSRSNERRESTDIAYLSSTGLNFTQFHDQKESILSSHTYFSRNIKQNVFKTGLRFNVREDDIVTGRAVDPESTILFYPYIQINLNPNKKINYQFGMGLFFDSRSGEWTTEPSFGLNYNVINRIKLDFSFRSASQYNFTDQQVLKLELKVPRLKSKNFQLGLHYKNKDFFVRSSVFYHHLKDVSNFNLNNIFSHFNILNGNNLGYDQLFQDQSFTYIGSAKAAIKGVDVHLENRASYGKGKLYFTANASAFSTKYQQPNSSVWYDSKYNYGYTSSVLLSYETDISTEVKKRELIFSISNHLRGGQREQILTQDPLSFTGSVYEVGSPFVHSLKPYQRLDFRVVYTSVKKGSKKLHRWSLDIQNLLSRENDGFRYYDRLLKKVILQKQLGLIPVLSYRIEW